MQQRLHLLIVNPDEETTLAARFGARWLLPSIICGEMVRAGPLAARWCVDRGIPGNVAGQWLGRVGDDAVDWLVVIAAAGADPPDGTFLEWISLDALANGRSVLDYQSWALRRTLERARLPSVPGPFGTLAWAEQVNSWIADRLQTTPGSYTPYRISAYETVLGFDTPQGRVYFKGLCADRISEAIVTGRFAASAPESFPRTLAYQHRGDATVWWITAECSGRPAADAVQVGAALARLQARLQRAAREIPQLTRIDLRDDVCPNLPECWIPMDLGSSNVLIDGEHVRFIDLDDSFIGPGPLAMAAFARRCGADPTAAYQAYEQSWSPSLENLDWRALEDLAIACQTRLGWHRLLLNIERGELHADLDVLRRRVSNAPASQRQRG
jgi:hypothetical protein